MALTNSQIERYSRQIIVPKIGGVGQERLLKSRLMIAGDPAFIEPALAYMVGAGVGTIFMHLPDGAAALDSAIAPMRDLNPDVTIQSTDHVPDRLDLIFALVSTSDALEGVRRLCNMRWSAPTVFTRIDSPAKIAVLPSRPPCPACAGGDLLAPIAKQSENANAGFVAMVAAVEALKILLQYTPAAQCMMIEFDGYESRPRKLRVRRGADVCACRTL